MIINISSNILPISAVANVIMSNILIACEKIFRCSYLSCFLSSIYLSNALVEHSHESSQNINPTEKSIIVVLNSNKHSVIGRFSIL